MNAGKAGGEGGMRGGGTKECEGGITFRSHQARKTFAGCSRQGRITTVVALSLAALLFLVTLGKWTSPLSQWKLSPCVLTQRRGRAHKLGASQGVNNLWWIPPASNPNIVICRRRRCSRCRRVTYLCRHRVWGGHMRGACRLKCQGGGGPRQRGQEGRQRKRLHWLYG